MKIHHITESEYDDLEDDDKFGRNYECDVCGVQQRYGHCAMPHLADEELGDDFICFGSLCFDCYRKLQNHDIGTSHRITPHDLGWRLGRKLPPNPLIPHQQYNNWIFCPEHAAYLSKIEESSVYDDLEDADAFGDKCPDCREPSDNFCDHCLQPYCDNHLNLIVKVNGKVWPHEKYGNDWYRLAKQQALKTPQGDINQIRIDNLCNNCLEQFPEGTRPEDYLNESSEYDDLEDADQFDQSESIFLAVYEALPERVRNWPKNEIWIEKAITLGGIDIDEIIRYVVDAYLEAGHPLADTESGYPE